MPKAIDETKRKLAFQKLIESKMDINSTVDWMLKEFKDDPAIAGAKNPAQLCRNIFDLPATRPTSRLTGFSSAKPLTSTARRWC